MCADVTVVYSFHSENKEKGASGPVKLTSSYTELNVGDRLIIKRDSTTPIEAREIRFLQDSNYDLLEFVDIVTYQRGFADGIILRAVKEGETQIQIVPRNNDPRYSAVLSSAILRIKITA